MRRALATAALLAGFSLVSCVDGNRDPSNLSGPDPSHDLGAQLAPAPGTCTNLGNLEALANNVFGPRSPWARSISKEFGRLRSQIAAKEFPQAKETALNIVKLVETRWAEGSQPGTEDQKDELVFKIMCFAGFDVGEFDPGGVVVVTASTTEEQEGYRDDGQAGFVAPPGAFNAPDGTPVVITITEAPNGLLNTKLDQYPGVFDFSSSAGLNTSVVVGVCLTVDVPEPILSRLRLGHDLPAAAFEITPDADPPPGLDCPASFGFLDKLPPWLAALGRFLLPNPVYAVALGGGGVGGSAGQFSPFGPVDPRLTATGGVGGSAGQFAPPALAQALDGPRRPSVVVDCSVPAGTPVIPACRPEITILTEQGTKLTGVPVDYTVEVGDGSVAPEQPVGCGTFSDSIRAFTNADAKARACWTLGSVGEQRVRGRPRAGGDAPEGVTFSPPSYTFTTTATAFSDGFETESGWTATGFWHRSTLRDESNNPFINSAYTDGLVNLAVGDASAGALPAPFGGSYAFWYGEDPPKGNYIGTRANSDVGSGGTSTAANSGTLTSPTILVPAYGMLRFNAWFEIESVDPDVFDGMIVSVEQVDPPGATVELGRLNPAFDPNGGAATPFTSGGFNVAPIWFEVAQNLGAWSGMSIRLKFEFTTGDVLYNGFRGWLVDNVRVLSEPPIDGPAASAAIGSGGLNPPQPSRPRSP